MERRDLFRIVTVGAAGASMMPAQGDPGPTPRFFSPGEYQALNLLCEAIIPADDEAGGAVEAGVPRYIDTVAFHASDAVKTTWLDGLTSIEQTAQQMFGVPVARLSSAQITELLTRLATNEAAPANRAERFFARLKAITIEAYFQSEVGMKYARYKGNSGSLTFRGCDHRDHHRA